MTKVINFNTFENHILLSHKYYKQGHVLTEEGFVKGYCFANLLRRAWRWIRNNDDLKRFVSPKFLIYWHSLGEKGFRRGFQQNKNLYTREDLCEMDWVIAH